MTVFGYVIQTQYTGAGELMIRVRIPSIHGPYDKSQYDGKSVRNYVEDKDIPWCQSIILPETPGKGDVVAVTALNEGNTNFLVIGLMGTTYKSTSK